VEELGKQHESNNPETQKPGADLRKKLLLGAVALVTAAGAAFAVIQPFDKTGKVSSYEPANPLPPNIDDTFRVASWNMHSDTTEHVGKIKEIIKEYDTDVMALQEVQPEEVQKLAGNFPRWHLSYVIADGRSKPAGGGNHANVLMTRQPPQDVKAVKIEGSGNVESVWERLEGFVIDAASARDYVSGDPEQAENEEPDIESLKNTRNKVQEHRAALAVTIKAGKQDKRDVRIITGHIAGLKTVHDGQREQLIKFIKDNDKDGRPTVFCGDLNASQREIIPKFARLGGFIVDRTSSTSDSGKTLDYCAYNEAGFLGLGDTKVLKKYMTDHHPIVTRWYISKDD
jgi:endonuclease/exonuclease/phosphatase family metal-dependent hydrolase